MVERVASRSSIPAPMRRRGSLSHAGSTDPRPGGLPMPPNARVDSTHAVAVEHLTKRYGPLVAVDDLSFEIPAGQMLALLGPNGAGKSTTIDMVRGLARPDAG